MISVYGWNWLCEESPTADTAPATEVEQSSYSTMLYVVNNVTFFVSPGMSAASSVRL